MFWIEGRILLYRFWKLRLWESCDDGRKTKLWEFREKDVSKIPTRWKDTGLRRIQCLEIHESGNGQLFCVSAASSFYGYFSVPKFHNVGRLISLITQHRFFLFASKIYVELSLFQVVFNLVLFQCAHILVRMEWSASSHYLFLFLFIYLFLFILIIYFYFYF